jgi:hypothetical protein
VRFLTAGIGFTLALSGLVAPNLVAGAEPLNISLPAQAPSYNLTLQQDKSATDRTVVRGNGVEFSAPIGFQGGSPSSDDTNRLIKAVTDLNPSLASFSKLLEKDPSIFRAIAFNTSEQSSPEVILISAPPFPASVPLEDIEAMLTEFLPSMMPGFKLSEHKIVNLGSRQIAMFTVNASDRGVQLQESIGLFREGDDIFQVTYAYAKKDSLQARSIFNQIVNTFKATPIATKTTTPI